MGEWCSEVDWVGQQVAKTLFRVAMSQPKRYPTGIKINSGPCLLVDAFFGAIV